MSDYPSDWRECLLGEVVEKITSGGTPKADNPDLYGGDIPFLKIDDITSSSKYLRSHKVTINERGLSESSAKIVPTGTILLTMYGTIGRCCITTYPVATNQAIASFLGHPEVELEYLYYTLESKTDEFATASSQTTQANISAGILKQTPIAIPPLPEQKKIAEILSGIDIEIAVLVRAKEKLERIALAYLGIAVPPDCESLELQQLCKITDGAHKTPTYTTEGVPFLRVTDIKSGQLDQSSFKFIPIEEHLELTRRCRPEKGDVLLSKNGTIGIPRLIDWDWEFSIFVSLALLKIKDINKILPEFLEMLLVSPSLTSQMFATSKQGTVTNLHLEEIRKFKIHLPPPEEQFEIVRKYRSLNGLIGNYSLLIEKKSLLKRGLSSDLLSGRKRVCI
jgi:type I restriction enzyme, S subunit